MANNDPSREEVKPLVVDDIYWSMKRFGRPKRDYTKDDLMNNEGLHMTADLGLPKWVREGLAIPFTKLSKDKYGGKQITRSKASKAASVKACIDLVHKQANDKS